MKPQIILTVTSGRSGTGYLHNILKRNRHIHSEHESSIPDQNFWNKVFKKIQDEGVKIYAETSHLINKGFIEPLIYDFEIVPDLIILKRDHRSVAKSLTQLGTVPHRTAVGKKYLISPEDSQSLTTLTKFQDLTDYQLNYWYCLEIEQRQIYYKKLINEFNGKFYETSIDKLKNGDIINIFKEFKIPYDEKFLNKNDSFINSTVNSKNNSKSKLEIGNLDEQEKIVRSRIIIKE